jgi:hypothetical protein
MTDVASENSSIETIETSDTNDMNLVGSILRHGSNALDSSSSTERSNRVMLSAAKHLLPPALDANEGQSGIYGITT